MNTKPIIHPVTCLRCGDSGIVNRPPFNEPCDCPAGAERGRPESTPDQTIADLRARLARVQAERDDWQQGSNAEARAHDEARQQLRCAFTERDAACAYAGRLLAEHQHMVAELSDQGAVHRDDDGRLLWSSNGDYVADQP